MRPSPVRVTSSTASMSGCGPADRRRRHARSRDPPSTRIVACVHDSPRYEQQDRVQALAEARRIARPGAPVFVTAISRWAPRLHGYLVRRLFQQYPDMGTLVEQLERDGRIPPLFPGSFSGYAHHPRDEIHAVGMTVEDLVSVEGLAFALPDLDRRMADPSERDVVLATARALQRVPELLGLGPHLLAVARLRSAH